MINLIVAMDRRGLIGLDQKIPWHSKEDLKNFARLTKGNTVVMGRKTYESIGEPLPDRKNIIVSTKGINLYNECTTPVYVRGGVVWTFDLIREIEKKNRDEQFFIIGGMEIYKAFAPYVDRLYLTVIDQKTPLTGKESVFFPWPAFSGSSWLCQEQRMLGPDYFYVYDKVKAANNGEQKRETGSGPTGEHSLLG